MDGTTCWRSARSCGRWTSVGKLYRCAKIVDGGKWTDPEQKVKNFSKCGGEPLTGTVNLPFLLQGFHEGKLLSTEGRRSPVYDLPLTDEVLVAGSQGQLRAEVCDTDSKNSAAWYHAPVVCSLDAA